MQNSTVTALTGQSIVPKLVIGQPGMDTLTSVQDEINDIQQFGEFVDIVLLAGADASRDNVLHGLTSPAMTTWEIILSYF